MWYIGKTYGVAIPWIGSTVYVNPELGLSCYFDNISNKWVISSQLGRSISLSFASGTTETYAPSGSREGVPMYSGPRGVIWKEDRGPRYILSALAGCMTAEYSFTGSDGLTHYMGDEWWYSLNDIAAVNNGSFTSRGSNYGDASKNGTWSFVAPGEYWEQDASGIFQPRGTASGTKYVGALILRDNKGHTYIQQAPPTGGKSSFTTTSANVAQIEWNAALSCYTIGAVSTTPGAGYWRGPAQLPKSPSAPAATFARVWNEKQGASDPAAYDLTISFVLWGGYNPFSMSVYNMAVGCFL